MSKRFTDTEKWKRPWFRSLPDKYKILWCYILDSCDRAGVWYVDMELAGFLIKSKLNRQEAESYFSKQIEIKGDRWLIKDFIPFQYGDLTETNKIYKAVHRDLEDFKRRGIDGGSKGHISSIHGGKDKDMNMIKNKVKDKEGGMGGENGLPKFTSEDLIGLWNDKAHPNLPRAQILTGTRDVHIRKRMENLQTREQWEGVIKKINSSKFLSGQVVTKDGKSFKCTFDWMLSPTNLTKIIEGNYDDER